MILAIGLGGALGALLRYFITSMIFNQLGNQFPWGTLTVNLLGCALLGFLITIFSYSWSSSEEIRSFFNIGLIGALTTFSAFSIEVVLMIEKGNWLMAASYVVLSVICCVGVTMVSMFVTKTIIS
tara:strand:+ start:4256 stop:4630 length:375 start_codon:yes stop_codon:yes gene_type:complete